MGAMIYGDPRVERIFLSDATFWSGEPSAANNNPHGPRIVAEVRRLLLFLADRDRLRLLAAIRDAFEARVMDAAKVVSADVVTAVPLPAHDEAALAAALGKVTGRQVTIQPRVDPSIVGGVVARVGSLVIDGSVVRQMARLRERLLGEA